METLGVARKANFGHSAMKANPPIQQQKKSHEVTKPTKTTITHNNRGLLIFSVTAHHFMKNNRPTLHEGTSCDPNPILAGATLPSTERPKTISGLSNTTSDLANQDHDHPHRPTHSKKKHLAKVTKDHQRSSNRKSQRIPNPRCIHQVWRAVRKR